MLWVHLGWESSDDAEKANSQSHGKVWGSIGRSLNDPVYVDRDEYGKNKSDDDTSEAAQKFVANHQLPVWNLHEYSLSFLSLYIAMTNDADFMIILLMFGIG